MVHETDNCTLIFDYFIPDVYEHRYKHGFPFDDDASAGGDDTNYPHGSQPTTKLLHWSLEAQGNVPNLTLHDTLKLFRNPNSH